MRQSGLVLLFVLFCGTVLSWRTVGLGEETSPKVYLNHFYLLLDSSTYKDIIESDFIKNTFAHFEERTTVVNDNTSYSGAYVYGENTYFEFFDESKSQDSMPQGSTSGMAFAVEKKDELKIIQKKLKAYKNAYYALRTREFEGAQIPWFCMTGVFYGETAPDIMTWVMEYHEDFLKKWHPDLAPSSAGITRKDVLARYAAKIAAPEQPRTKRLKDVIEIYLNLNQKDFEIVGGELSVLGYESSVKDNKKIYADPDIKFVIEIIDSGQGKITGIKMSLHPNRHKEETFIFGKKSRLTLHPDNTATWYF